jgi:hypothetical protein
LKYELMVKARMRILGMGLLVQAEFQAFAWGAQ